jgi:hypothetical protein
MNGELMEMKDVEKYIITELEKLIAWYDAEKSRPIEEPPPGEIFIHNKFFSWITNEIKEYRLTTSDGIVLDVAVLPGYKNPRVYVDVGMNIKPMVLEPWWFSKSYRTIVKSFKAIEALEDRRRRDLDQIETQKFLKQITELCNKTYHRY